MKIENFILTKNQAKIFITLRKNGRPYCISKLTKEIDCTYAYISKIIRRLEKDGYLTATVEGRSKILKLTNKGEEAAYHVSKLLELAK